MTMVGNKWVAVYTDHKGKERERLVSAGINRLALPVRTFDGIGQIVYAWDGQTRDPQGRRVYA